MYASGFAKWLSNDHARKMRLNVKALRCRNMCFPDEILFPALEKPVEIVWAIIFLIAVILQCNTPELTLS